jgi:predicted SAM-dependent methyltransferase
MNVRADELARRLHLSRLVPVAKTAVVQARRVERSVRGTDAALIASYFDQHETKKLQLGSGSNHIPGWLNSDLNNLADACVYLNARKRFPFSGRTFDYVFSEHMIEHIPYSDGLFMLTECHRVLKAGGLLRIATPDLQFLVDLHRSDKSPLQQDYVDWATRSFVKGAPYPADVFVINNFFRGWGHLFIYDEATLTSALEEAGFVDVTRCGVNQSEHEAFRGLENEARMPDGFLRLESLVLEARST